MADIDVLSARVRKRASGDEPLELLRAAVGVTEQLLGTADELVHRYVAAARATGCSWSQIGDVLGVSRQAAQQRFGGAGAGSEEIEMAMSPRLRRVVRLGHKEARLFGAEQVGTGQLLLGVLKDGRGLAAKLLAEHGVDFEAMTESLDGQPPERAGGGGGFTSDAAEALRLGLTEARSLSADRVGTEHLLLGLLRLGRGAAWRVLREYELDADGLRDELVALQEGPGLTVHGGRLRTTVKR